MEVLRKRNSNILALSFSDSIRGSRLFWPRILAGLILLPIFYFLFSNTANALVLKSPPNNLGLVGYWKLDDATSTRATDFSGSGNAGVFFGGPSWVNGKRGKALSFNGSSDYVRVSSPTPLPTGSSARTLSAWVKLDTAGSYGEIISYGQGDCTGKQFGIGSRSGNVSFWSGCADFESSLTIPIGQWAFIAVVYSGTTVTTYLNGNSQSQSVGTLDTQSSHLFIGGETTDNGSSIRTYFDGAIDDVRLYARALSGAEIRALYGAGQPTGKARNNNGLVAYYSFEDATSTKATDFSGNGNTATFSGSPTWSAGKRGKAVSLTGGGEFVSVPVTSSTLFAPGSQYSISAWFKKTNTDTADGAIFSQYGSGTSAELRLIVRDGAGDFQALYLDDSTIRFQYTPSFANIKNQWHHAILTTNNGSAVFYIDGAPRASSTYTVGAATFNSISIGKSGSGAYAFTGQIDDVRIYNRALSATEALNLYTAGAETANPTVTTVSRNGLVGYWNLDDGTSTKATDFSGNGKTGTIFNMEAADWVDGKRGKALDFGGSNEYVEQDAALVSAYPVTISAWIKGTAATGMIVNIADKDVADQYFALRVSSGFAAAVNRSGGLPTATSAVTVNDGNWHHLVALFAAHNSRSIYVDGALSGTNTTVNSLPDNTDRWCIARLCSSSPGDYYIGTIDDVRVYSRALSGDEIRTLYLTGR